MFKKKEPEKSQEKQDFYKEAKNWHYDMYQSQTVWLKRALLGLGIMSVFLFMALIALIALIPLKERVPYLYTFNHATGEIMKLGRLEPTTLTANWELDRYFMTHYVINRESYNSDNIDYPYQIAWAMSDESTRRQYDAEVSSDTKTSPYRVYGKNKFVTVQVLSISKLNENAAEIKFDKTLHDRNSETQQTVHKEAIIKWKYVKEVATQKVLDRNPLGFKVTYYQVTQINTD